MANLQLKDLIPGRTYNIQVRSTNANGELSEWSNTYTFVAPPDTSQTISNIYQSQVGPTSGVLISSTFDGTLGTNFDIKVTSGKIDSTTNPATGRPWSGNTGWAIDYVGNAIFNNAYIRGTLQAGNVVVGNNAFSTYPGIQINSSNYWYLNGSNQGVFNFGGSNGIKYDPAVDNKIHLGSDVVVDGGVNANSFSIDSNNYWTPVTSNGTIIGANLKVGNSSNYLKWDYNSSTLTISGSITSTATITGGTISGGSIVGGNISIGTGNSIFKADTSGIYLGNSVFASAPFSVTPAGLLTATSGTIGGFTLGINSLTAGSGSTAVGLNTTGYPFYAGNATPASAPFRVTSAGVLNATGATISGALTATSGYFTGTVNISTGGSLVAGTVTDGVTIDSTGLYGYEQGSNVFSIPTSSSLSPTIGKFKVVDTAIYSNGADTNLIIGTRGFAGIISGGTIGTVTTEVVGTTTYYLATITSMTNATNLVIGQVITATSGTGSIPASTIVTKINSSSSINISSINAITAGTVTNITGTGGYNITLRGQDSGGSSPATPAAIFTTINGLSTTDSSNNGFYVDRAGKFRLAGAGGSITMDGNGNLTATGKIQATSGYMASGYLAGTDSGWEITAAHISSTGGTAINKIVLDSGTQDNNPKIFIAKDGNGSYNNIDTPFYADSTGKLSIGQGINSLVYDPATGVQVTGSIQGTTGYFGGQNGWKFGNDGILYSGLGDGKVGLASSDAKFTGSISTIPIYSILADDEYQVYGELFSTIYIEVDITGLDLTKYSPDYGGDTRNFLQKFYTYKQQNPTANTISSLLNNLGFQVYDVYKSKAFFVQWIYGNDQAGGYPVYSSPQAAMAINPVLVSQSGTTVTLYCNEIFNGFTTPNGTNNILQSGQTIYTDFAGITGLSQLTGNHVIAATPTYTTMDIGMLTNGVPNGFNTKLGVVTFTATSGTIALRTAYTSTQQSSFSVPLTGNRYTFTIYPEDQGLQIHNSPNNTIEGYYTYLTNNPSFSFYDQYSLQSGSNSSTYYMWAGDDDPKQAEFSIIKVNEPVSSSLPSKIVVSGIAGTTPVGSVTMWTTPNLPYAWKICDGSSLYTYDYSKLHKALSNRYGGTAYPSTQTTATGTVGTNTIIVANAAGFIAGYSIIGYGIAVGTTITGVTGTTITLSNPLTATITNLEVDAYAPNQTTATGTSGTNTITVASALGMVVNYGISGTLIGSGIPDGTRITAITGTTITLSANLTASLPAGTSIKFGPDILGATTTFNIPDLRGRFILGASSGTMPTGRLSKALQTASDAFTHNHTTDIQHGHGNNFGINAHNHSDNFGATVNGSVSSSSNASVVYKSTSNTAITIIGNHSHGDNFAASINGSVSTNNATNQGGNLNGSVTGQGATSTSTASQTEILPPYYALYFIIYAGQNKLI